MCNATRDIMDCMFEAVLDASQDPDDIPQTTEPFWLLGKKYNTLNGNRLTYFYQINVNYVLYYVSNPCR